jgi:hypothetical protein
MYVARYRRMSDRNRDGENLAGTIVAPQAMATAAATPLEWNSGIDR